MAKSFLLKRRGSDERGGRCACTARRRDDERENEDCGLRKNSPTPATALDPRCRSQAGNVRPRLQTAAGILPRLVELQLCGWEFIRDGRGSRKKPVEPRLFLAALTEKAGQRLAQFFPCADASRSVWMLSRRHPLGRRTRVLYRPNMNLPLPALEDLDDFVVAHEAHAELRKQTVCPEACVE